MRTVSQQGKPSGDVMYNVMTIVNPAVYVKIALKKERDKERKACAGSNLH